MLAVVSFVATAPHAAVAQQADDASLARVRGDLEKPPSRLTLKDREPDFRIEIHDHERERWMKMFETPLWQQEKEWRPDHWLMPDQWGHYPPLLFSVDLLQIAQGIARRRDEARREREQRDAVDEVRQEIAAWCAAQPDPSTIEICRR